MTTVVPELLTHTMNNVKYPTEILSNDVKDGLFSNLQENISKAMLNYEPV